MKYAALLLVCACGRIAFDPLSEGPPIDAPTDGDHDTAPRACLSNPAYTTAPGTALVNRYREGAPLVSWEAALADCVADGAHLWIVDSAAELTAWTGDWTAITDVVTEGTWVTIDGAPATYLPWLAGQPDGSTAENCVRADTGGFEDRDCNDLRDYVCECPVD